MEDMFWKDLNQFDNGCYETTYTNRVGGNINYTCDLIAYLMDSPQHADTLHIGRDCSDQIVKGEKLKRCSVCLAWDYSDDIDGLLDKDCLPNLPLDCSILKSNGKLPCRKMTLVQLSKAVDK
eukprot:4682198-Ditylum_brightwellii.AAC.1